MPVKVPPTFTGFDSSAQASLLNNERFNNQEHNNELSIDEFTVPRFILEKKLGEGGMASVYLASQESNGRTVALKILARRHLQHDSV